MGAALSPQVRLVALLGLLAAAGLGLWTTTLAHRESVATAPVVSVTTPTTAVTTTPAAAPKPKPVVRIDSDLPASLRSALRYSKVVVAAVYIPKVARDVQTMREAAAGAHAAHVGFVALDVRNEHVAAAIAGRLDPVADPAVLVVVRPGTVVTQLDDYADRDTVAQAAANARR